MSMKEFRERISIAVQDRCTARYMAFFDDQRELPPPGSIINWPSGIEQVIDAHVDRAKREMTGDGLEFGQIPPQGRIREQTLLLTTGYCANTPVEETYMKAWDAFRRIVEAD